MSRDTGGRRQAEGRWSPVDRAKALERLANARANLSGLERQDTPAIEPGIRVTVEQRQLQIDELRAAVGQRGRAGRQARQQLEALEGTQGLVIECLGYHNFNEFAHAAARFDATRVDERVILAARHEVDRAERHFFDTAEMAIPVPPTPFDAPRQAPPMPTGQARRPRRAS